MDKSRELSIIVYSCWKHRDMWKVFSILFKKYWRECPYKVVLLTDKYKDIGCNSVFDDVVIIDDTWARMIKKAITQVDSPYVLLCMDDYLLCDYVETKEIERQLNRAKKYHVANLRLVESPKHNGIFPKDSKLGYYKPGEAYSVSTQVGIWDTKLLYSVIDDKWSAWDFERIGSLRGCFKTYPLLVTLDYVFPYEEGVRQGKWMEAGVKLCKRNGIDLNPKERAIMSNKEMAKIYIKGAILDWNPTLIVRIQNFLKRI